MRKPQLDYLLLFLKTACHLELACYDAYRPPSLRDDFLLLYSPNRIVRIVQPVALPASIGSAAIGIGAWWLGTHQLERLGHLCLFLRRRNGQAILKTLHSRVQEMWIPSSSKVLYSKILAGDTEALRWANTKAEQVAGQWALPYCTLLPNHTSAAHNGDLVGSEHIHEVRAAAD